MSLRINNNIEAFNAHRQLTGTSDRVQKSMERLSSGSRINRAADDAAGLAISEKLRGQIRGLSQAQRNAQDAVSLVQTAEGSLGEVHSMLQRVRELAVQYKAGTLSDSDKAAITAEANQLMSEIERIGSAAEFNGIKLLDGTAGTSGTISFQVGANDDDSTISVTTESLGSKVSGLSVDGSGRPTRRRRASCRCCGKQGNTGRAVEGSARSTDTGGLRAARLRSPGWAGVKGLG